MATYSVVFSNCSRISCAGQTNPEVIVCVVDPTVLLNNKNTFEGVLKQVYRDNNACGTTTWRYVVTYDSAVLDDPDTPLNSADIESLFCKGCLTEWVEDLIIPPAISVSNGSFSFHTVSFGNLNGVSFYSSNGSVVASVSGGGGGTSSVAFSASGGSSAFQTLNFANSNGITFSNQGGSVVASFNALTSQSNQALSAANGSFTFQTATFADSNGVSFSTGTQGIFATVKTDYLTSQSNQALSGSNGSFTFQTATFGNLNGFSFYTSNGSVVGSYTVPAAGTPAFSASGGSSTFNTLNFANSNGLTFSNSNGSVVASYTVPTITNSSWTVSDPSSSGSVARLAFTNLNGVTLSLSTGAAGLHTIVGSVQTSYLTSQSNQALSAANGSFAFQTATFANSNGVSFSTGTQGIFATVKTDYVTSQSNPAFSASGGSSTFQTLNFANSNGLTFSNSNGSVIASYSVPTLTNSSWTVSDSATSGTVARLAFTNLNGVTLSLSTGVAGLHTIVGSHNGLTSQSNQAVSAANGSFTFQTLSLANSNGVSFSTGTQGVFASVAAAGGGATLNVWEPYFVHVAAMSTTNAFQAASTASPTFFMQPLIAPQNVAISRMNIYQNFSNSQVSTTFALNTTGQSSSRAFNASFTWGMGLYTRQSGTNSSLISALTTLQLTGLVQQTYAASVLLSNSLGASATINFVIPLSISSDWNYVYTTLTQSQTNSTSATNTSMSFSNFTSLDAARVVALPFSSMMTPGEYWVGLSFGSSTDVANIGWRTNGIYYAQDVGINNAVFLGIFASHTDGIGTSASAWMLEGAGYASTNASTTAMPGQFTLSNISRLGVATMPRIYLNFSNYSL